MRQPGLEFSERRLVRDWPERFGHPLLLLETFVDPARFRGTIYRAANWLALGQTRGYRRTRPLTPVRHDVNVAPQDFAVAGTCIYVPPGSNGPGSEKPSIDSTFA
jgi:hypothetical protein